MENKSHALAAGTFVLVVTLLLVSLVLWLTRDKGQYQNYELTTPDAITGLQPQAAVRYKGVSVGKVNTISFDHQVKGNVLIRIQVDEKAPISSTTYATLAYQGVTGLAYVLLNDSGAPQKPQPAGDDGLPRLPLVTSELGKMTEQAPELLAQINEATVRINQLLSDDNQRRLSTMLSSLAKVSENTAELTAKLNHTVQTRLDPALATVPALAHEATLTLKTLQTNAADVGRMSNAITQTAQRLNERNGPLDRIAESADAFSHVIDTLGTTTLPRVNRVAEDASRTARLLGRTVTGLNDNPQSLLFGAGQMLPGPGETGFTPPPAAARP